MQRSSSSDAHSRIGGIGTFSGRAPLAPGRLPGFTGPFPSTSLDKGIFSFPIRRTHPNTDTVSRFAGLGGALRAPLGPVVAALVPRCALLPAPTPRMMGLRPPGTFRVPKRLAAGEVGKHYGG